LRRRYLNFIPKNKTNPNAFKKAMDDFERKDNELFNNYNMGLDTNSPGVNS